MPEPSQSGSGASTLAAPARGKIGVRLSCEHVFVPKTHPAYIRDKAIQMRVERHMSIDEIAERLALSKTTIYYWVKDIPLGRERRPFRPRGRGGPTMTKARAKLAREIAYTWGRASYPFLSEDPLFRDFVSLYIAEGFKRNRNCVSVANSDSAVIRLVTRYIMRFSKRKLDFAVQYHADQDLAELRTFWAEVVGVDPSDIKVQRKSNSNQLKGRTWRSRYGVLTVRTNDTAFRATLGGWMDSMRAEWT
jgi:hypothetical protein